MRARSRPRSRSSSCRPSTPAACALAIDRAGARRASAPAPRWCARAAPGDAPVYGVNTGFGKLANHAHRCRAGSTRCSCNLIRSHSVGVGEPLAAAGGAADAGAQGGEPGARRTRACASGVIDTLLAVLQRRPRALRAEPGLGRRVGRPGAARAPDAGADGRGRDAGRRPARAGGRGAARGRHRAARRSRAKEGLALINGTQVSTALALHALFTLRAGARGRARGRRADGRRRARQRRPVRPAHPRAARPAGADRRRAATTARCSPAARSARSHRSGDDRVQDPYCLRCQPQVVGACLDQLRHAALVLLREANAVTDNPLVFADDRRDRSRAATSTPSRWRSPPTRWRSRSPRSARSPSAASRC